MSTAAADSRTVIVLSSSKWRIGYAKGRDLQKIWNEDSDGNSSNELIDFWTKTSRNCSLESFLNLGPQSLCAHAAHNFLFPVFKPCDNDKCWLIVCLLKGASTGNYSKARLEEVERRQVLTGLENIITQATNDEALPVRSSFFGINIKWSTHRAYIYSSIEQGVVDTRYTVQHVVYD